MGTTQNEQGQSRRRPPAPPLDPATAAILERHAREAVRDGKALMVLPDTRGGGLKVYQMDLSAFDHIKEAD